MGIILEPRGRKTSSIERYYQRTGEDTAEKED
jgi:hypothetical protein